MDLQRTVQNWQAGFSFCWLQLSCTLLAIKPSTKLRAIEPSGDLVLVLAVDWTYLRYYWYICRSHPPCSTFSLCKFPLYLYYTLRRNVFVFGVRRLNFSGEAFACSTSLYHVFSFWWFAYSLTFSPNSPHSYRASTFVFYVNFTIGLSMFVFVVGLCISLKMLTGNFLDRSPLLFPTVPST